MKHGKVASPNTYEGGRSRGYGAASWGDGNDSDLLRLSTEYQGAPTPCLP